MMQPGDENQSRERKSALPRPRGSSRSSAQLKAQPLLSDVTSSINNQMPPPPTNAIANSKRTDMTGEPPLRRKTSKRLISGGGTDGIGSYGPKPTSASSSRSSSVSRIGRPTSGFGFNSAASQTRKPLSRPPSARSISRGGQDEDQELSTRKSHSNNDWDPDDKFKDMGNLFDQFFKTVGKANTHHEGVKDALDLYKGRVQELESKQDRLTEHNINLRVELDSANTRVSLAEQSKNDLTREHTRSVESLEQKHHMEIDSLRHEAKAHVDSEKARFAQEMQELQRKFHAEIDLERTNRRQEVEQWTSQANLKRQHEESVLLNAERQIQQLQDECERLRNDLARGNRSKELLEDNVANSQSVILSLETTVKALKAKIEFLESGSKQKADAFARMDEQLRDALVQTKTAKEKLFKEETLRRKLHNQVQELKGNIRVFCRVRPMLQSDPSDDVAYFQYPDIESGDREITVQGPEERNIMGNITTKSHSFAFDHVFSPSAENAFIFEEISQLVQSALDGYNVCIFCYGQTGSGKTYTMSAEDGMITQAMHQIYETASSLREKGWTYTMHGNFVEVYNENINDLLGTADDLDNKKHEIRHDMQRCRTTITDVNTVVLDCPSTVQAMLRRAATNRSVAATKSNERSSRSHSVFILRLTGENSITGERSEGVLNLVDLAGSERLSQSQSEGLRLKETQNINRSLSCLGDVIAALGQQGAGQPGKEAATAYIPYRNSKLTYLLQFSLGGNSKTLMFVMVSPRRSHLNETLTSLKFATKVHNTHIGTATQQKKTVPRIGP